MADVICTCIHPYQDSIYGKQHRVANYARKGNNGNPGLRCTVCSRMHPATQTLAQENAINKGTSKGRGG